MFESRNDLYEFLSVLFWSTVLVFCIGVVVVAGLFTVCSIITLLFPPKPYMFDYPAPLDVCPQTHINSVIRDNIINVDYINMRGDTIYLVYEAQRGNVAIFQSQQVLDGNDCPR